jgi:hypothetical protein
MVHNMLRELHNGESPIIVDQSLLCDCNAKVKVHPCNWDGCSMHVALEHKHISKHLQQRHGIDTTTTSKEAQKVSCLWLDCYHSQLKPGKLARHVLSTHLGVRWICLTCRRSYAREDAFRRHTQEEEGCQFAAYEVSCNFREIDTESIIGGWSSNQNAICL